MRHHHRRYRRNPFDGRGFFSNTLVPAAIGAGGAVAVDYTLSMFGNNLPQALTSPTIQPVLRVGIALGLGAAVGAIAKDSKVGAEVAAGGVLVTLYQLFSQYASGTQSGTQGGGGQFSSQGGGFGQQMGRLGARRVMRRRRRFGVGYNAAFVRGRIPRTMGYIGPARTVGRYMSRYV